MKHLLHFLFFLVPALTFSQVSVVASVSQNPVAVGEKFDLKFTVLNYDITKLRAPSLPDFEIISGPNKSTSWTYANGKGFESGSYTYIIKAKQAGRFTIGKAVVDKEGVSYYSDEVTVVVTAKNQVNDFSKLPDSDKSFFDNVFRSPDSIYMKDGKAIGKKSELISECVKVAKTKEKDGFRLNAEPACNCLLETVSKHYTYDEFVGQTKAKDVFSIVADEKSPAYTEMLRCVLSNMVMSEKNADKKTTQKKKETDKDQDNMRLSFMDACEGAAKTAFAKKDVKINAATYCECTWDKIKEKGLSIDKLADVSNPSSPFFNEVVMPCVMKAMAGESENPITEETKKSPEDITGKAVTAKIPLTRMAGVYSMKVTVGTVTKYFILDSGAGDMFISSDFERELLLEGLIKKSDYLSGKSYQMANGETVECRRLKLNNIQIGDYTVNNVVAAVNESSNTMLLLGKSLLDKFSHWSIDNKADVLVLTK